MPPLTNNRVTAPKPCVVCLPTRLCSSLIDIGACSSWQLGRTRRLLCLRSSFAYLGPISPPLHHIKRFTHELAKLKHRGVSRHNKNRVAIVGPFKGSVNGLSNIFERWNGFGVLGF